MLISEQASLWCWQSVYSVPRESLTEGVYGAHFEISLHSAYFVIRLSLECNDSRYFRTPYRNFRRVPNLLRVKEASI